MFGSGRRTVGMRATEAHRVMAVLGLKAAAIGVWLGADLGVTTLTGRVLLTVAGLHPLSVTRGWGYASLGHPAVLVHG